MTCARWADVSPKLPGRQACFTLVVRITDQWVFVHSLRSHVVAESVGQNPASLTHNFGQIVRRIGKQARFGLQFFRQLRDGLVLALICADRDH